MEFDSGVKSARERMDFDGAFDGASVWFPTKGHALGVQTAFSEWNKVRRLKLVTTIEKTFYDDPSGRGYRLHWSADLSVDANEDSGFREWVEARLVTNSRRPLDGWHLISALHGDYEEYSAGRGTPLSIVKFSGKMAALPGVSRERMARGSVAVGASLKDDVVANTMVETDLRAAIQRQQEELEKMGYGSGPKKDRPQTLEELLAAEREREARQDDDSADDEMNSEAANCATCSDMFDVDVLDDAGNCSKCALLKRIRE